jgi:hypothetical protein
MTTVVQINDRNPGRNAPGSRAGSDMDLGARNVDDAESTQPFCRQEPNGSWTAWIEEEESALRQQWGTSKARLKSFTDVVAGLGFALTRTGPDRFCFSINDVVNDVDQLIIAMTRLTAFRQLFLEDHQPRKLAAALAPARPGEAVADAADPREQPETPAAPRPGSDANASVKAFPALFTGDKIDAKQRSAVRKEKAVDHLAVVRQAYPRIAAGIEATWGNIECENYMNKLIMSDRGDRRGFSAPVLEALLALFQRHTKEFRFTSKLDKWAENNGRHGPS